jgi:hypothetical protein
MPKFIAVKFKIETGFCKKTTKQQTTTNNNKTTNNKQQTTTTQHFITYRVMTIYNKIISI